MEGGWMKNNSIFKNEAGFTIITFMFIMAMLGALAIGALQMSTLNIESSNAQSRGKKAFYAAEVGLDLAVNEIIQSFENLSPYTTTAENGGDGDGFLFENNYRDHEVKYKITNPESRYLYETVKGNSILSHFAYTYDIQAESSTVDAKESVLEKIRILETPLVQWFIFYGGDGGNSSDLEIEPYPGMTTWGRIHANGDIYLRAGPGNELRFQNFDPNEGDPLAAPHSITAGGIIYNKRKKNMVNSDGVPRIKTTNTTLDWEDDLPINFVIDQDAQEAAFNDFVFVKEPLIQAPGNSQFQRGGFYETRAANTQRDDVDGIQILGQGALGAGMTVIISGPLANTDVTTLILRGETSFGNLYSGPMPIIRETRGILEDCREGKTVDTTDIDLYALEKWFQEYLLDPANSGGSLGEAGFLVYASRSPDASFTNSTDPMQAIRLMKNNLLSTPKLINKTTFASDNPIYIDGDFNTVNTQGAAIIGDAINLLSKNWDDSKTCSGGLPSAGIVGNTGSKVRASLFSGYTPTTSQGGTYGGGVHNFMRYHERWTGINSDFKGAMIGLWVSQQATGNWCQTSGGANCYEPPERLYGWDTNFADPDYWPPFIPSIFGVERVGFLE